MDLPTDGALDRVWQYFSTDGFYKIPLGNSTFDIYALDDLRGGMNGFPDRASVEKLRYYKIKTVVLHLESIPDLPAVQNGIVVEPPDPAAAAEKPIAGLGITTAPRRRRRHLRDRARTRGPARQRLMSEQQPVTPAEPSTGRRQRGKGLVPRGRARLALLAILLVGISYATMIQSFSWNQTSHYDLIRSLNDDGTTIDA